ncbi:hypothetical protein H2201_002893 [Coniosporium apollinis]|uniref:Cysteine-rich PDZ-binding protein n=2 Tax=Coniosporium TaxID=2810619 RepID=A0ABQ9P2J1_9PEZI|nr:hypothetical protein H2199_006480 [Cladosporium sp. JES 115]KAJ9667058.1 hypothetical protein H2201_002893 [Coniosporium apollinis]
MVCSKCQQLQRQTQLATPAVKKKNEMYYGSPAGNKTSSTSGSKPSATLGQTGVSKSKLLSKSAKNPYAMYSSSCDKCKTKVDSGKKYCHRCAYKENSCETCGKSLTKSSSAKGAPIVQGQRFSAK